MKAKLRHFPTNENSLSPANIQLKAKGCCSVRRKKDSRRKIKGQDITKRVNMCINLSED